MKKSLVFNVLAALAMICIPTIILPVCGLSKSGMHMSCYYTKLMCIGGGIAIFALSALGYFIQYKYYHGLQHLLSALIALFCAIAPLRTVIKIGNMKMMGWQIGLCKPNMGMACIDHTWPVLSVVLLFIAVVNVVCLGALCLARRK